MFSSISQMPGSEHQTNSNKRPPYIDELPNEMLSYIHVIATHLHEGDYARYRFPSVLCQVSRRWREIAHSSPNAWSFIFISNAHTFENTAARIARTGNVPLNVKITDFYALLEPGGVMELIVAESNRWMSFWLGAGDITPYVHHLPETLPICRTLHLATHSEQPDVELSLPQLQSLKLVTARLASDYSTPFPNLTELRLERVRFPFEKLQSHLSNSPNLTTLEISNSWLLMSDQDTMLENSFSYVVELPRMTTLILDALFWWEALMLLSSLRAPALQVLMLHIIENDEDEDEAPFLLRIRRLRTNLPCLRKLVLNDWHIGKEEAELLFLQIPEIQELVMIEGLRAQVGILEAIFMKPALARMTSRLSTICIKDVPNEVLVDCFSSSSLPETSRSLKERVTLKIHSAIDPPSSTDKILLELGLLIPHLKITDDNSSWDIWDT